MAKEELAMISQHRRKGWRVNDGALASPPFELLLNHWHIKAQKNVCPLIARGKSK
jgi:hypothetical protein